MCNFRIMSNLIILYDYHEAPPFLLGNPHIKSGYRGYLPTKLCLKSLFTLHNESINIWSHLLVGLFFFIHYFTDYSLVRTDDNTTIYDQLAFFTMIAAVQIAMFASAAYHLFNCQSEEAHFRFLLTDCIGIAIGLSGCFFPVMHYAFYCFPELKVFYGVILGSMFGTAGYVVTRPWFGEKQYTYFRIVTYSVVALSGIIPSAHWTVLHGLKSDIVATFIPRIVLLYAFGGAGAFFYVTRIPEVLLPGRFDFIGHSHQIWHILAALVFIVGHKTQQDLFVWVSSHPCPGQN